MAATLPDLPPELLERPPAALAIDRDRLEDVPGRWKDRLSADVDALLEAKFQLLGAPRTSRTAWEKEPETGMNWPREPVWSLDLHRDTHEVKLTLEMQRLQVQQLLALGSVVLGRDDARHAVLDDLRSYLSWEAPFRGVGWVSGIECASRVASLLVVAGLLGPDTIPGSLRAHWWRSIQAHGVWIERYPSLHSSANNHRIAELGALLALAVCAPDLERAETAEGYADDLARVAARQFHPDGVGAEQSPSYQAYTMEWLLWARRLAAQASLPFDVDAQLEAGAGFLRTLMDERGRVPHIGDDDEGVVLRQSLAPEALPRSVCGAVAGVLDRPAVAPPGWEGDLRSAVLSVQVRAGLERVPSRCFEEGGYTVLRWDAPGGQAVLVFDHGPLGFPSTAGHGHADALAVWLGVGGRPLLVDSGTYRYNGSPAWRAWMRSTAAHNTVEVGGADQSEMRGPFNWGRRAQVQLVDVDLELARVAALHDGYLATQGWVHLRQVRVVHGNTIEVEDMLAGEGVAWVAVAWHLAPGLRWAARGPGRWEVRDGSGRVALLELEADGIDGRVERGGTGPGVGLISPSFGNLVPSSCLVLEGELAAAERIVQRFLLQPPP